MGIFDTVSEFFGGGADEAVNQIQDAGSQHLEDATQTVEDTIAQASEIFPGDNSNEKQNTFYFSCGMKLCGSCEARILLTAISGLS